MRLRLYLEELLSKGDGDGLGAVLRAELAANYVEMLIYRIGGDAKVVRYLVA